MTREAETERGPVVVKVGGSVLADGLSPELLAAPDARRRPWSWSTAAAPT